MINYHAINDTMQHLVGWEQSYNPANKIDEELTHSDSGLYFQAAHPLLTLDNMAAIMPADWDLQYPSWNNQLYYHENDVVKHANQFWKCTIPICIGSEPSATNPNWEAYNTLNDFLKMLTSAGLKKAIQTFIEVKQLQEETKSLLERRTFFDGAGRLNATLQNRGQLVGFEIVPVRSMGVVAKIERIGLQMVGGTGTIRLYLFHSSQKEPINSMDCEFTSENGIFQWFYPEDWYLPNTNEFADEGGAWYIVYNQNDLPQGMQAINVSKDWSREPCGTCNIGSLETWRELTKYLQISPFQTHAYETFAEYPEMWDVAEMAYTNTQNYGLNVEVSVGCDLTEFIIRQKQIFANIVQKQVAFDALRTLALNPNVRVNRNQSNASKMDLLYELDGNTNSNRPAGLGYELKKAYDAANLDTRGLDRICLRCNNHGVKYRTV